MTVTLNTNVKTQLGTSLKTAQLSFGNWFPGCLIKVAMAITQNILLLLKQNLCCCIKIRIFSVEKLGASDLLGKTFVANSLK